jgi:hypothetical protein
MNSNRMGSTRRKSNRKVWLTGTLTLGALAASGGVATAALTHSPEHASGATARVAASLPAPKILSATKAPQGNGGAKSDHERARGPVCLRLDKNAQKAIAAAAAASHGSVVVPVGKIDVVPCPKPKAAPPAPVKATTATKSTNPSPVAPAPAPAPAPAVSSSAS